MSKQERIKRERAERRENAVAEAAADSQADPAFNGPAWQEFARLLNDLNVAYAYTLHGLQGHTSQHDEVMNRLQPDPNKPLKVMSPPPWTNGAPVYGEKLVRDMPRYLRVEVPMFLGHQWAVRVDTAWEELYRERIADELGLKNKREISYSPMADLRRFRNDIVHHHGVATKDNSGKAGIFDWTRVGQPILIGEDQIVRFMEELGLLKRASRAESDEMEAAMNAGQTEKARLGVDKLTMRFDTPPLVKCRRCKLPREDESPDCSKCGLEQAFSAA